MSLFQTVNVKFSSKVIMLIGSSMTQKAFDLEQEGFGIGLSDWYNRLADIIVRGQSGYNSRWTLLGINELLGPYKPDLVVLFLGNNDSTMEGGQYIPLEEYKVNMEKIVISLKERNPDLDLIFITPTRANKAGRSDEFTFQYAEIVRSISKSTPQSAILETWEGPFSITKEDLCDGLHLGVGGNRKILTGLKNVIRESFPEYVPFNDDVPPVHDGKRLNWLFPKWNNLAGKSMEESTEIIEQARTKRE